VKGCAPRAQKALASLPWAKDVKVDFDRKKATFTAERNRYDESAILKVLQDEGFEGKIVN
jgi:copper chaperone CopZ